MTLDIYHKSRERIKSLGEVYTPPKFVNLLLDTLDQDIFSCEETAFFEPTCGNGNIVIGIVKKRLYALLKKYKKQNHTHPVQMAIVCTIKNLWACDIDLQNVNECRKRVLDEVFKFFDQEHGGHHIQYNGVYFEPVADIIWKQITHNDMLSGLCSDYESAKKAAYQTKASRAFFDEHGWKKLEFLK